MWLLPFGVELPKNFDRNYSKWTEQKTTRREAAAAATTVKQEAIIENAYPIIVVVHFKHTNLWLCTHFFVIFNSATDYSFSFSEITWSCILRIATCGIWIAWKREKEREKESISPFQTSINRVHTRWIWICVVREYLNWARCNRKTPHKIE